MDSYCTPCMHQSDYTDKLMPKNATNEKKFSEIKIFSKIYKGKIFQKFTAQFHRARRTVFYKSILISRVLKRVKLAKHRNKAPPYFYCSTQNASPLTSPIIVCKRVFNPKKTLIY